MFGELAAFALVSMAVIATPGQDTALTIRTTLQGGRRAGWATAAGVATGQAGWTLAAAAGLTSLLLASELAFTIVKVLGAGYLLFLGLQALWSARHGRASDEHTTSGHASPSAKTAFRQGLLSNLSNPKMAAFFGSLLPQFSPADGSTFWTLLALGLMFCLLTLAWLSLYASAIGRLGVVMRRPRVRQVVDAVTGTALVVLGVRLATQRQPG